MRKAIFFLVGILVLGGIAFILLPRAVEERDQATRDTPLPNVTEAHGLVVADPDRAPEGETYLHWAIGEKVRLIWAGHGLTTQASLFIVDERGTVLDELPNNPELFQMLNEHGGSYVYTVPEKLDGMRVRLRVMQKTQDGTILTDESDGLVEVRLGS